MIDLDELERLIKAADDGGWDSDCKLGDYKTIEWIPAWRLMAALRNSAPEMIRELKILRHACESWKAEEAENHAEIERLRKHSAEDLVLIEAWNEELGENQKEIVRLRALVAEAWDASSAWTIGSHRDFQQIHPDKATWLAEKGVR